MSWLHGSGQQVPPASGCLAGPESSQSLCERADGHSKRGDARWTNPSRCTVVSALADLARLRGKGHGLYGSGDRLFSNAIFGRDSVTAGETLLHLRPEVARDIILTLARLQGTVDAPVGPHSNEEERGKIHHEHRTLYVDGRRIPPDSERLLRELAGKWGGDETSLTYYGSADATPLFVRLVARYCATHGE